MTPASTRTGHRSHSGRELRGGPLSLARWLMLFAGLLLLMLTLPPFLDFPLLHFWLVPLALVYLLLLWLHPRLWLYVLPAATIGLDLTPWTGRFTFNEFDLLFLVTIASGLMFGRYRWRVFYPRPATIVLFCYLAVVAMGYSGWLYFLLPPRSAWDNPYYTSEYAYKVFRGIIWGIALVPMWGYLLAIHKQRAVTALLAGMCLAAVLLGLVVLWERGTLGVLLAGSAWYQAVNSLLDLSSSYRVTALFSDMHTGGEVIDGVILLLLPVTLHAAMYGRVPWLRVLGASALIALGYVTLVGFTRATYVAVALGLTGYGFLALRARHLSGSSLPVPLGGLAITAAAGLVSATLTFLLAGSFGLACYGALILLAFAKIQLQLQGLLRFGTPVLALILTGLAMKAHMDGRWVAPSLTGGVLMVLGLIGSYALAGRLFQDCRGLTQIDRLFILGGIVVLPGLVALAVGGPHINGRLTRVSDDLEARQNHWRDVLTSASGGFFNQILGNGVGSFPGNYIATHPQKIEEVGSFTVFEQERREVLQLGGGHDLVLGQRVSIEPYTLYTLTLHLRAEQSGRIRASLCERNLIYTSNFMPRCEHAMISFESTEGEFEAHSVKINSGELGQDSVLNRWPIVMSLLYNAPGTVIDIDSIELSSGGFNVLHNGSFKDGLDYWFYYNDFSHLPWHVKNAWLQVWFESGWLGVLLSLTLVTFVVRFTLQRRSYDSLAMVYTVGLVTLCVFGFFGSPLDSSRVSWIFYFFLGAGLAHLRVRPRGRHSG